MYITINISPSIMMAQLLTLFLFISLVIEGESHKFSRSLSQKSLALKKEKLTRLHFYLHDIVVGDHPTAVRVADAAITNTSSSLFGATVVLNDPLTVGPEKASKTVGRAQGIYAFDGLDKFGLLMVVNFVFAEGKYNGSTLSMLGRNPFLSKVREMPIVGGSGLFRFACGYALAKTYFLDTSNGNTVVEYDVYVLHY